MQLQQTAVTGIRSTPSRLTFADIIDFVEARKPWWSKQTRKQIECQVAIAFRDNTCISVSQNYEGPFVLLQFVVYGKLRNKNLIEIQMACGDLDYAGLAIERFKQYFPEVTHVLYQRKSKYLKRLVRLDRLQHYLV